ncbi:hypothetical protein OM076_04365 [Solirubrobacter ginsenosidimutans]|uniref:Uncharacterized protein n=1 Tax=Solirubrobacter ginsenosidimutans TaxID=490573 RepID=A0A9X3MTN2_9ACTN|nr:hypothetical protein [Solirubrobacter ginsenosidimutans]MDA0159488.1 hypothetical protein [Solirubrobacter ginsenosidimutans]
MSCVVCSLATDGGAPVHPECVGPGLLREAVLAVAELLAVVTTPVVIVWAG